MTALYSHVRGLPLAAATVGTKTVSVRSLRSVLLAVAHYLDAGTWAGAFPSMATLAERAELSVSTARRAVRALEAAGVLVTEPGGGRRSNRYRLHRPAAAEPLAASAGPGSPVPGTDDSGVSISHSPFGRVRRARSREDRLTAVPEDLASLADALVARGLRAAFSLTGRQVADVRGVMARAGVPAMVTAAYRAHRATDPARWWSAWLELWSGLHVPARGDEAPAEPAPEPCPMVGLAARPAAVTAELAAVRARAAAAGARHRSA